MIRGQHKHMRTQLCDVWKCRVNLRTYLSADMLHTGKLAKAVVDLAKVLVEGTLRHEPPAVAPKDMPRLRRHGNCT